MSETQKVSMGLGTMTAIKHQLMDDDKGMRWMRDHKAAKARKKARYLKNRAARAEFYSQNDGAISGGNIPIWHSTINALSAGTYG